MMINQPIKSVLLCTVGGSHEPIVCAIRDTRPDHVCFVCSNDDPATGQKGSYQQVIGKGLIIRAAPGDIKPTLPNIPTQAGLTEDQYEIFKVDPDSFDDIYAKLNKWLAGRDRAEDKIIADYTGGTKTMSAALVTFALDEDGVGLQLITGSRANLIKVESGGGYVTPASVDGARLRRRIQEAVSVWSRHAYAEAEELLENIPSPKDAQQFGQLHRAHDLSKAFAAWDRFDHTAAQTILLRYRKLLGKTHGTMYNILGKLTEDGAAREPLQLFDLYRNAQRRAAAQRYDDAIARLYRLVEWSAQWLLQEHTGIKTADVAEEKIPQGMALHKNRKGQYQAGLFQAWELAAYHCGDAIGEFWEAEQRHLLDRINARNLSILAHGFQPLQKQAWLDFSDWAGNKLNPLLLSITDDKVKYRIHTLPPQLPDAYNQLVQQT
jgi:CRISPR-associated protein (TIGR02710 family)